MPCAGSAPLRDDAVVRERLAHYQQAAETARSELAALQAKHQSIHAQLQDVLSRLTSRDAAVQELREELEGYKETGARQASLVDTLRERLRDAEQEIGVLVSSKARLDATLQALANENYELNARGLELESQSQKYLNGWNKTKQEASDTKRTYQEFVSKLAIRLPMDLARGEAPLDFIVSQVDSLCQQSKGQKGKICTLEESVEALEVECRASRETVMRLVAEELNTIFLAKRNAEKENQSLQEMLQASQRALAASRQELGGLEQRSHELDSSLLSSHIETQTLQARERAFREEVAALLGGECTTVPPTEEDLQERLRDLCSRENSGKEALLEMEAKVSWMSEKLAEQKELHQGALQRAQQAEQQGRELGGRLRQLEAELLSGEVLQDGLRHSRQHYECFLEQLSEKMKLEGVTADLGFDMRLEAVLSRAEQLMKAQKERLESKELHTDLLRRKVAQLEEEKKARSALAVERDDAHLGARKLQKKVERLQDQMGSLRLSNTELKAQLAHTYELKVKVMEQNQTITEQNKSLGELEKRKERAEKKLTTAKSEFHAKSHQAMEDQQQAQVLLESHSNELRTLRQTVAELNKTERQLADFRKVVSEMLGLDVSMLAVPDYEIIKRLEWLLHPYHHHHQHPLVSGAPWPCPVQQHPQEDPAAERAQIAGPKALPAPSEASL
ncbi:hypothetical protein AAFF_G00411540 [Aldrovandia affinis]|uniref:Coiled-coil domain-containing protein 170 n=1 Tax=Aldrovandia affinis TaxID=143900 RepID=A0AAD7SBT9_9TELE|nr:hypothetical protein AAFF_G00411540 [Aldrovandia affinis]